MARSTVWEGEKRGLERAHRHLEHPSNAVQVQHVAMPISFPIEEWGWPVRWTGM